MENQPIAGQLSKQQDINEKMRAILVDWLVEVHLKFKLLPETLYLTINLIDRYLGVEQVHRSRLQLVGVTSMLIASKYEEIYAPIVKDFVYITDNAYSAAEILAMERQMLFAIDFSIQTASASRFLDRYAKVSEADSTVHNMGRYLLELAHVQARMMKYPPSMQAASALYLSLKMLKKQHPWNQELEKHTHFSEQEVRTCAREHFRNLQEAQGSSLQAVRKKYSQSKFSEVAKIQLDVGRKEKE